MIFLFLLDVVIEMEYDERLANFRQQRLNPFDRGEDEEDDVHGGKTPPKYGNTNSSAELISEPE